MADLDHTDLGDLDNLEMGEGEDQIEHLKSQLAGLEDQEKQLKAEAAALGMPGGGGAGVGEADKEEVDARSVYIGNVDYSTTPEDLQAFFQSCGTINRVTILCDKFTGHPKGFAYVEFADQNAVAGALMMNETVFKGRVIKVSAKRTNIPGVTLRGRGRGRGAPRGFRGAPPFRGGGGYRGGYGYGGYDDGYGGIKIILNAAGLGLENVVDLTVFLVDMKDYAGMNEVYNEYFKAETGPSRTTVAVHQLPLDKLLVEIKVRRGVTERGVQGLIRH
ncbi:cytoplasmic RNA-binding protein [Gonapodya sp. JEL0774]|nr:cytoplasmic RNA-binding protein [Gonapodya sp. JEL0774]